MNGLMEYLPPVQQAPASAPAHGAGKYHGQIAQQYEQKRENDPKWLVEQKVITGLLDDLPQGTVALDVPCGTGRFFPFYASKGFVIVGMDISMDMLKQAEGKSLPCAPAKGSMLVQGDCRKTGLQDKSVDVTVNCRITRWLSPDDCQAMFREMQRVARKRIIWTARVANHQHARSVELFEGALTHGWRITRNEAGYVTDYRILMAECAG